MKNKIYGIFEIVISLIMVAIIIMSKIGPNFIYIITLTLLIGWILPFFTVFISGISYLIKNNYRLFLIMNIFGSLTCLVFFFLLGKIYDKTFLILIIEYSICFIICLFNIFITIKKIRKEEEKEIKQIKEIKDKNNGIVK